MSLATSGWQLSKFFFKRLKMPPLTPFGGIFQEWFKQGSRNFTHMLWTIGPTNMPHMTSLALSGRLQNAIKYRTKVRKTGAVGINQSINQSKAFVAPSGA